MTNLNADEKEITFEIGCGLMVIHIVSIIVICITAYEITKLVMK